MGFAVDGVLEACVKPGALTAGFRETGEGYGLESGLCFIFWRLNSYPPPPTPFWTSVASILLCCLWVFQQWFTARVVAVVGSPQSAPVNLVIRYSAPELASISSQKFALITRHTDHVAILSKKCDFDVIKRWIRQGQSDWVNVKGFSFQWQKEVKSKCIHIKFTDETISRSATIY